MRRASRRSASPPARGARGRAAPWAGGPAARPPGAATATPLFRGGRAVGGRPVELHPRSRARGASSRDARQEVVQVVSARACLPRPLKIGIGGPVGSGKTALTEALCLRLRDAFDMAVITNDIYTKEDAEFLVRRGALPAARVVGVETGGCPHTAIREDASVNLEATHLLMREFPKLDLLLIESGGDNLAATFSPELVDATIYVIDVRSEEHTSELQSHHDLVCRRLLEKKKPHHVRDQPALREPHVWQAHLRPRHRLLSAFSVLSLLESLGNLFAGLAIQAHQPFEFVFFLMLHPPPRSTLFPYTTLFRSTCS